jgi:hypothetical protein
VSDECIHGFEPGMCATCFPKAIPEAPAVAVMQPRPRGTATRGRAAPVVKRVAGSASVSDVGEQRIYHLTHVNNLAGILTAGAISPGLEPIVDISPAGARDERDDVEIPGLPEVKLSEFVPFFLSPNALMWQSIRSGAAHPRVSRDIQGSEAADFVLLVSTVRKVMETEQVFAVTDGAAETDTTRFGVAKPDAEKMLQRLRSDAGADALLEAELIVHGPVSLESVSLIGVAHDKARAVVRQILTDTDADAKVAVYPPWFAAE